MCHVVCTVPCLGSGCSDASGFSVVWGLHVFHGSVRERDVKALVAAVFCCNFSANMLG